MAETTTPTSGESSPLTVGASRGKFVHLRKEASPDSVQTSLDRVFYNNSLNFEIDTISKIDKGLLDDSVVDLSKKMENLATDGGDDDFMRYPLKEIRNQMFRLSAAVGNLATIFLDREEIPSPCHDINNNNANNVLASGLVALLNQVIHLADLLSIDLVYVVETKMELNRRKYPVHLCKGKAGKYTEYSGHTGITKDQGQTTLTNADGKKDIEYNSSVFVRDLPVLTNRIRQFAIDRDWQIYHTPRNLLLALTGELGELIELVQFKGDDLHCTFTPPELDKLGQETADVTIYLLRLADICSIDLYEMINLSI